MSNYKLTLKIEPSDFYSYSNNYEYQTDAILKDLAASAKQKMHLTKKEFLIICAWKTPRTKVLCASNSEEFIKEVTHIAFTTESDQIRIEILTLLRGVSWPTASAILHFCHKDPYPILDFRALFSLGYTEIPVYNYTFWKAYTEYCRKLAKVYKCDVRAVDRALWQYSKKHQDKTRENIASKNIN